MKRVVEGREQDAYIEFAKDASNIEREAAEEEEEADQQKK